MSNIAVIANSDISNKRGGLADIGLLANYRLSTVKTIKHVSTSD